MSQHTEPTPEQIAQLEHVAKMPALVNPQFAWGHMEINGVKIVLLTLMHPTAGPINMLLPDIAVESLTSGLAMLIAPHRDKMS